MVQEEQMRGGIHDLEGVALISSTGVPATQEVFIIHKGDLSVSLNTQQIDQQFKRNSSFIRGP